MDERKLRPSHGLGRGQVTTSNRSEPEGLCEHVAASVQRRSTGSRGWLFLWPALGPSFLVLLYILQPLPSSTSLSLRSSSK